jgi:hypothetical protein
VRYRWPDEAVQTFSVKATATQDCRWVDAARSAGYKHTPKWLAEAADHYAAKRPATVAKRRGGIKGGVRRANKLTPERRAEIAKKAAAR